MYAQPSIDLALYRMERAEGDLKGARNNIALEDFYTAANRSYYAIFNAMRALLNLESKDFKRHSGVIAEFRRDFIKTGVLPPELSDIIRDSFKLRNASDYDDFYIVSKEKVKEQTENAAYFVETVKRCLMERIHNSSDTPAFRAGSGMEERQP